MEPIINGHLIKKPPQSGHLQSTAKRPLSIVRMSNFMQGQDGNLWQTIETEKAWLKLGTWSTTYELRVIMMIENRVVIMMIIDFS